MLSSQEKKIIIKNISKQAQCSLIELEIFLTAYKNIIQDKSKNENEVLYEDTEKKISNLELRIKEEKEIIKVSEVKIKEMELLDGNTSVISTSTNIQKN